MIAPFMVPSGELTPEEVQAIYNLIAGYQVATALAILFGIAAGGLFFAWLIFEKWITPSDSKRIRTAARKKRPLEFIAGDDGYLDIMDAAQGIAEGVLETSKIGTINDSHIGALPRPIEFSEKDIEVSEGKDLKATVAMANFVSRQATRRLMLRGAKIPVWVGYRGKAILVSLYGLVALQLIDGLVQNAKAFGDKFEEAIGKIDIIAIKDLFGEQWEESQIHALAYEKERKGEAKAKRFGGKESLIMLFAIMIFLVVLVIILLAAAYYFTGGGA